MGTYEILDHTADTGIRIEGRSLSELIEAGAVGMFALMADAEYSSSGTEIEFEMSPRPADDMVVDVLAELLYRSEIEDALLCDIEVRETDRGVIEVTAAGVPWSDVELTGPPIKAVTYHDLEVKQEGGTWTAIVYFDV